MLACDGGEKQKEKKNEFCSFSLVQKTCSLFLEKILFSLTRRPQAERVSAEGANLVNLSPNCKKCAPLTSEKTTKNCSPPLTPADHNQSKQSSHTCLGHPLSCQKSGDTTPLAISDLEIGQKGFSAVAQQWRRVHLPLILLFLFIPLATGKQIHIPQDGGESKWGPGEGREAGWERGEERLEDNFSS